MMPDGLFRQEMGIPLVRDPPWKGIPLYSFFQSLNPAQIRTPQHQPYKPHSGVGDSLRTRGPQARHSTTPARPSAAGQAQENVRARAHTHTRTRGRHPETPGNPFNPSTHRCQNAPIPTNRVFNPPREPPHLASALGQSPPPPEEVEPLPGIPPQSPPLESSPPARRLLRLLVAVAGAGASTATPTPAPAAPSRSLVDPQAPVTSQPLVQGDPNPGLEPNWK